MSSDSNPNPNAPATQPQVSDIAIDATDAILERLLGSYNWKPIVAAVLVVVIPALTTYLNHLNTVAEVQKNRDQTIEVAKEIKQTVADRKDATVSPIVVLPKKVGDEADIAKLLMDGFASLGAKIDSLGKKIDDKPVPTPVDPDKPKPPSGLIPSRLAIAVGPAAIKVVSSNASAQWYWEPGLSVDVHAGYVYVSAMKDGEYLLVAYTSDGKRINDFAACRVTAGTAPQPPPGPVPTPEPKPPTPTPLTGFRVLMVYDPDSLSPDQESVVYGKKVRDYLREKCSLGADGKTKDFRIYRVGLDTSAEVAWINNAIQRAVGNRTYISIGDGKTDAYLGPLPANENEALTLLKKIGG